MPQNRISKFFWTLILCLALFACASKIQGKEPTQGCRALLAGPIEELYPLSILRKKAVDGWEIMFEWALKPSYKPYPYLAKMEHLWAFDGSLRDSFLRNYGYFSPFRPLVGVVSEACCDMEVVGCLFRWLYEHNRGTQLQFACDEVLTKVLAYRKLAEGTVFDLPQIRSGRMEMIQYRVEHIIDMWRGMPAFVLVPTIQGKGPPCLLFRGTDFSLSSEKGWASVLSDLDPKGAGYRTFMQSASKVKAVLHELYQTKGPVRLMGYSLGGAFVLYTLCAFGEYLTQDPSLPSVAYHPPGWSQAVAGTIQKTTFLPPCKIYVSEGDFVSKTGFLPEGIETWSITTEKELGVIASHVHLMCLEDKLFVKRVDVLQENAMRKNR